MERSHVCRTAEELHHPGLPDQKHYQIPEEDGKEMTAIAEQIAHISKVANAWCDIALVCAGIGLALSIAAAIILFIKIKEEEDHGKR